MKLTVKRPLPPGEAVVTLFGFRPLRAAVRWYENGHAGLAFGELVKSHELVEWMHIRRGLVSPSVPVQPIKAGVAARG